MPNDTDVAGKPNAHFTEDDGPAECVGCDHPFGTEACQKCKALSDFDAACDAEAAKRPPAKLYHGGYAMRCDELYAFAHAVADGKLTAEQLRPQMRPSIHQAVCALADEIAAARIPLVAIGPDWDFLPAGANWIQPGREIVTPPPYVTEPTRPGRHVLMVLGYITFGVGLGLALARWMWGA